VLDVHRDLPRAAPTCSDHFHPGFVGGAADGHAAEPNDSNFPWSSGRTSVGLLEPLQDDLDARRAHGRATSVSLCL
jgi:hypothetical protein